MEKIKILLLGLALLFLSGCQKNVAVTEQLFAMDTYMEITVYGDEHAAQKGAEELKRLEGLLNREALTNGTVAEETAQAIKTALVVAHETEGAFDPTVAPLTDLWGFYGGEFSVPSEQELQNTLTQVGYERVSLHGNQLDTGNCVLDLGGIGKGFASDRCCELLKNEGVTSAILSLGGNIQTIGRKPDGSFWRIGIADPQNPNETICTVEVEGKAVVTSGGYQRNFEQNGKQYHHILNPKTGYPAESELLSVTVIGESATMCDALSTALFVMGFDKAVSFWETKKGFDMILITEEIIYHTCGISPKEAMKTLRCLE